MLFATVRTTVGNICTALSQSVSSGTRCCGTNIVRLPGITGRTLMLFCVLTWTAGVAGASRSAQRNRVAAPLQVSSVHVVNQPV